MARAENGFGARRLVRLVAAALLLAGCQAQPIGTFDSARIASEAAQAQTDLYFRPGTAAMLPGEAERINGLLRSLLLRPQDDVVLRFGSTGSDVLDARRIAEARRRIAAAPARMRVVAPLGFARAPDRPDVALLQVLRYDSLRVECPGSGRTNENPALLTPIPVEGCANAVNLAVMAAEKRDVTAPRRLEGSDAALGVAAVERLRAGTVSVVSLASVSN